MNYHLLFYVYLLLNNGATLSSNYNWTFMPTLQELCPYTSFCEENATMSFPTSNTKRPCCDSCSCKPGCEKDGNCCFGKTDTRKKCMAATVNVKTTSIHYMMIHSCLVNPHVAENRTMCLYDDTDHKSFAPVVSEKSKDIFVNSECASCNKAYDTIPWKLALYCPRSEDFDSYDLVQLLNGEDVRNGGCYLGYVPPKHLNLASQECRHDVIRECNVSQKALEWEPLWQYCPLFNALYSTLTYTYGNIFCFLCNEGYDYAIASVCLGGGQKQPTSVAFTAILDDVGSVELDSETVPNEGVCRPTETLIHSFQTRCRRVECSLGKIRLGGECKFFSKEWIGDTIFVVLKLTPLDRSTKIDVSVIANIQPEFKNDGKPRWLKRKAMKNWIVRKLLYAPSADKQYVEYFVAFPQYPFSTMNPSRLWIILQRTLNETWVLTIKNTTVPLQVQFNRRKHYQMMHKSVLQRQNIIIDQEYGYIHTYSAHNDSDERYLLGVYDIEYYSNGPIYLNELFLCNQIKLLPEEFEEYREFIVLKQTNEVLSEAEFTRSMTGEYHVCLNRFRLNKGVSDFRHVELEMTIVLFISVLRIILLTV